MNEQNKTPISTLQEVCARNNLTVEYQLLQVEGVVHAPTFKYRVQIGPDIEANGDGQSKKKAKHAAALAALKRVREVYPNIEGSDEVEEAINLFEPQDESIDITEEENSDLNPVGKLQEICMKKHVRPPEYITMSEEGLPHEREFIVKCTIPDMSVNQTGKGRSKKIAKRHAASTMLKYLEQIGFADLSTEDTFERRHLNIDGDSRELSGSVAKEKIDDFFATLDEDVCELLADRIGVQLKLQDCNYSTFLSSICSGGVGLAPASADNDSGVTTPTLPCTASYKDLEEQSKSGNYQSLVVLIPSDGLFRYPVLSEHGVGKSIEEARQDAAKEALSDLIKLISQPKKQLAYFDEHATPSPAPDR